MPLGHASIYINFIMFPLAKYLIIMYFTIFCQTINVFALFDHKIVLLEDHSAEVVKLFEQYDNIVIKLLINTHHKLHKSCFVEFLSKMHGWATVRTIKLNQCVAGYHVYRIYTMRLCLRQLLLETQSQLILYLYM